MSPGARVESVDALRALHAALARFGVQARGALDAAAQEVRHTLDALDERLAFWQQETARRQEDVNRARADLSRVRWLHDGERVGGSDQEIALLRARERLREAEEKVSTVRHWQRLLPDAVREYEGPARRLSGLLDSDLKQSLALLESKHAALKNYLEAQPPASAAPPSKQEGP